MGVYIALMRVSVRRETLHRSPPNQWGLACYTTTCFLSSSSSLITSVLPLSPPPPFSASLSLSHSFSIQLARDENEVSGQLAMKRALNGARWGHQKVAMLRTISVNLTRLVMVYLEYVPNTFGQHFRSCSCCQFMPESQCKCFVVLHFVFHWFGSTLHKYKLHTDFN